MDGFEQKYEAGIRVLSRNQEVEIEESTDGSWFLHICPKVS
jgi:hypothetical protein